MDTIAMEVSTLITEAFMALIGQLVFISDTPIAPDNPSLFRYH